MFVILSRYPTELSLRGRIQIIILFVPSGRRSDRSEIDTFNAFPGNRNFSVGRFAITANFDARRFPKMHDARKHVVRGEVRDQKKKRKVGRARRQLHGRDAACDCRPYVTNVCECHSHAQMCVYRDIICTQYLVHSG